MLALRGRGGVPVKRTTAAIVLALAACDRVAPPAPAEPTAAEKAAEKARGDAREHMSRILEASEAATARCVAGELHWEPDHDGNPVARHYSRPCIPERCTVAPADIESLRAHTARLRGVIEAEISLQVPSYQGFLALAEAMVSFADTARKGTAKESERPARWSGMSMHHGYLAAAYRELVPASKVPLEPPSLTASLAADNVGGDVCKGWAMPRYCDVRGVRVPREHRWRADPPCIEVEGIRK